MTEPTAQRWSIPKSQFVLICAAALADRRLQVEEREEIFALASRTPTLAEVSDTALRAIWEETLAEFERGALPRMINTALNNVPQDARFVISLYAHCCDIVYADRSVKRSETAFLNLLAKSLRINTAQRKRVDRVMAWKNGH